MKVKNESLIKKLQKTGFTDKEALVYVALLELGGAFPSRIAEYTGLKRATTYFVLTALSVRGLVNEIEKKNKLFYQIEKPQRIIKFAENQVGKAEDALDHTKALIPEINNIFSLLQNHPKITYYEGLDGLKSMYEDMINFKKPYEMVGFSKTSRAGNIFPKKFLNYYIRRKTEIGITSRALAPDTPENRKYFDVYKENNSGKSYPKTRFVDPKKFDFKGEIVMYGDNKVSITNFDENQLIGAVIEDKSLNQMMRVIFELSWDSRSARE